MAGIIFTDNIRSNGMLSIITAVFNQLPMNRLFLSYVKAYTHTPYELIVIDNNSTDGSADFFEAAGATVLRNSGNYSYPYCQNQGIKVAHHDILVFLNNDLIVSPQWDMHALAAMDHHGIDIGSCCATDSTETDETTRKSQRKWRCIRNPLLFFFGPRFFNLKLMFWLNYGNWAAWNKRRRDRFGLKVIEGIAGSNIIMRRSALKKIGLWDERITAADFDLAIRTKLRSVEKKDIKPVCLLLGVYLHHFIRLTVKSHNPPFADAENLIPLAKKWDADAINPIIDGCGVRLRKAVL